MIDGRVKEVIVDSRINKVLAMRTDSVAMLESLDAISEFYIVNTVEARRALRQDLELQNINLAKKFLVEFDQVKQRIESVEDYAVRLETSCKNLASKVAAADENMKFFMGKASELENRRNHLDEQSKEIASFLSRFQLSVDEVNVLNKAPIDNPASAKHFFEALQRLRTAYADCKAMVEKHSYSAGFELLDNLGQHQDAAYQRLFEWVKLQCDLLTESGNTEDIDVLLQTAIRFLRKLPTYYSQCQDLVIASRRSQLVQKFVLALTQGGPSTQAVRAIDLHAHDAIRYVGDMLAWMHQAVASEEEFLESVFGPAAVESPGAGGGARRAREHRSRNASAQDFSSSSSSNSEVSVGSALVGLSVQELLARCLQGLGRPLRVRIVQTLESRASLEVLYTLTDLLCFYEITFAKIIPIENSVHSAVKGCLKECRRLFLSQLNKQADALTQHSSSYPLDLTSTHSTRECCRQVQEILRVHDAALSPMPADPSDAGHVDAVLGSIIQPLLQACRLAGQSLQHGDMAIFMLNNVAAVQNELREAAKRAAASASSAGGGSRIVKEHAAAALTTRSPTATWLDLLDTEAETWVGVLVGEEVSRTLRRSDLDKLLELMEALPAGVVAASQAGLEAERVGGVLRAFYASLFSQVGPPAQLERLQDPELREVTRRRAADNISDAHAKVHQCVSSAAHGGYDPALGLLAHSVDEVRVLLGCS